MARTWKRHVPSAEMYLRKPHKRKYRRYTQRELPEIRLEECEGGGDTVPVGTLIAVGGIYAGTDQTVPCVDSGRERGIGVRAIEGIDICRIIDILACRGFDQPAHDIIVVRTMAVFARILSLISITLLPVIPCILQHPDAGCNQFPEAVSRIRAAI